MNVLKMTASAIALALAGSAFAADLPSRRAPAPYAAPVPLMTWTGFHVGVNAGAKFGGDQSALTAAAPASNNVPAGGGPAFLNLQLTAINAATGFIGVGQRTSAVLGVQAGYDYQFASSFLVGIEADAQGFIGGNRRGLFSIFAPNVDPILAGTGITSIGFVTKRTDWLGTVRGRLGYLVTPSFLIYGTGGLAYGEVRSSTGYVETRDAAGAAPIAAFGSYGKNRVGYTGGGGVEYMIAPGWSLKAEYLYYNLGTAFYNTGLAIGGGTAVLNYFSNVNRTRVRFDGQIARVGVNYHFWSPVAAPVVARY